MKKQFLEAGKIINTHGIRGEVKIDPWTDSPSFLCKIKTLYINAQPVKILAARQHNAFVIAKIDGCDNIDSAVKLKNKIIYIDRDDIKLEEGAFFLQDIIGLNVIDYETGEKLGVVSDIMELPAGNVYVVKGDREILIPANEEFIKETNIDGEYMKVSLLEGM